MDTSLAISQQPPSSLDQEAPSTHPSANPQRGLLYFDHYPWVLTLAALDVAFTWLILALGGSELNLFAAIVIHHTGLGGMLALKFGAMALVIAICEYIGKHRRVLGRRVASLAVALNTVPATVGLLCLSQFAAGYMGL
jgi:hypothetical protein